MLLTSLISWAEIQSAKFSATELGNRWWQHDQFGIFYDANNSNWYYHIDQGWIYVDKWEDNGTWLFLPLGDNNRSNESNSSLSEEVALGWMWSKAEHYPQLYNNELEDWMYFNKERNNSKYYCYSLKKYLAEDFIFKTNTSPEDWKYLEPLFFVDDYESYETDLFPDIDVSYAGYWNVTIPKDELALDDNWSSLIQSIQDDENIRKKIGIRKIEEDESNYFVKFQPNRTLVLSAIDPATSGSLLRVNVPGDRKWQDANVTIGGATFEDVVFSRPALSIGTVVLGKVAHPQVGVLNDRQLIRIHAQGIISASSN